MNSGIARAIEELLRERQHLAARLAKIDGVIAEMREMFHLPTSSSSVSPTPKPARQVAAPPATNGNSSGHASSTAREQRILNALRDGPRSPGELGAALQIDRMTLRGHIEELEGRGEVVCTGKTSGRRIALAGHEAARAAKEAP